MFSKVICGNALNIPLPDQSVQCVVTSPPYWGLRDYGTNGQLGLEDTPEEYTANMVTVFREVWRVMRDDGTLWLNLGDTYYQGNKGNSGELHFWDKQATNAGSVALRRGDRLAPNRLGHLDGLKPKDMVGIPWRVAFALQADGWYLRSDIIWHKPNPMPESVTDRPTKSHEYLFLLSKSERYYYDAEAIQEPATWSTEERRERASKNHKSVPTYERNGMRPLKKEYQDGVRAGAGNKMGRGAGWRNDPDNYVLTRNKRSVWTVATAPYPGAHFATFPPALVEPCILAGSGRGDMVLDPFAGTGTVGQVAAKHGRDFVGVELSMDYIKLAHSRLDVLPVMLPGM